MSSDLLDLTAATRTREREVLTHPRRETRMYKLLESTLIGLYPGSLTHVFVGVIIAVFGIVLYHHRDGRALGTTSRPDLYLVPGGWPLLGHLLQVLTSKEGQIGLRDRQNEWWTMQRENAKMKGIDRPLSITFPFLRILDSSDR